MSHFDVNLCHLRYFFTYCFKAQRNYFSMLTAAQRRPVAHCFPLQDDEEAWVLRSCNVSKLAWIRTPFELLISCGHMRMPMYVVGQSGLAWLVCQLHWWTCFLQTAKYLVGISIDYNSAHLNIRPSFLWLPLAPLLVLASECLTLHVGETHTSHNSCPKDVSYLQDSTTYDPSWLGATSVLEVEKDCRRVHLDNSKPTNINQS